MKLSFIVCTRNRSGSVERTLNSILAALANHPETSSQIIIVDNASTDQTALVINQWAATAACITSNIIILHNSDPGVSSSRNMALDQSTGDILVFTDDDCVVSENYVQDLVRHYREGPDLVIRGGRVELGSDQDLEFTTKTENHASRLAYPAHPGGFIHGCNMTCSRAVIDRIGGFDASFGPGAVFHAAEDTDFVYRGWAASVPVEYVPDMSVKHFHGRQDSRTVKRLHWSYQFGNGALYAKFLFRRPSLIKHLYWSARNAGREMLGGPGFNESLGLTWRAIVFANLAGSVTFYRYSAHMLLRGGRARLSARYSFRTRLFGSPS